MKEFVTYRKYISSETPLQNNMRQIIHLNNTFISSIDELKEEMQNNYLKQNFRRDVLSFFKDGVLSKWLEEDKVELVIPLGEDNGLSSSDNETYDVIHAAIVGNHVKDQIKSDFFEYFTIDCCEYKNVKNHPYKTSSYIKEKSYYAIPPECMTIRFSFKIIDLDNNEFVLSFGGQQKIVDFKNRKRGEIVQVEFDAKQLNRKKNVSLIEGRNIVCELNQISEPEMWRMNLPSSISYLLDHLRPVKRVKEQFRCTETMITQKQYKDVMGALPQGIEGGDEFPVYLDSFADCEKFIMKLNSLSKRHFILPNTHQWNMIVDDNVRTNLSRADIGSLQRCKDKGCNSKGIYNTTSNIVEFIQDGFYVIKDSSGNKFVNSKFTKQIGFHLIELA